MSWFGVVFLDFLNHTQITMKNEADTFTSKDSSVRTEVHHNPCRQFDDTVVANGSTARRLADMIAEMCTSASPHEPSPTGLAPRRSCNG